MREKGEPVPIRSRLALLLATALVLGVAAPAAASGAIDTARRTADAAAFEGRLIVVWKGVAPRTLNMAGVESTSGSSGRKANAPSSQAGSHYTRARSSCSVRSCGWGVTGDSTGSASSAGITLPPPRKEEPT